MTEFSIITFFSTSYAIWTSRILNRNKITYSMIPVPRHISSDCGYCVRFPSEAHNKVEELLSTEKVEYENIIKL